MSNINWEELIEEIYTVSEDACNKEVQKMLEDGVQYAVCSGNSVVDQLYDVCGGAYVKFKDLRSSAYRSYKKFIRERENDQKYDPYGLFHEYYHSGRQEWRVNRAVANAVKDYLNSVFGQGTVVVKTYID